MNMQEILEKIQKSMKKEQNNIRNGNLTEEEALSFLRKCSVHFKRSVTRVAGNTGVVKGDDEKDELGAWFVVASGCCAP